MTGQVLVGVKVAGECQCRRCWDEGEKPVNQWGFTSRPFIVCATCGNKRCPHATDHRNECTGSNETGQPGSDYA
jgi:hypothetical protein